MFIYSFREYGTFNLLLTTSVTKCLSIKINICRNKDYEYKIIVLKTNCIILQVTNDMHELVDKYNIHSDLYMCRNDPTDCYSKQKYTEARYHKIRNMSISVNIAEVNGKCIFL